MIFVLKVYLHKWKIYEKMIINRQKNSRTTGSANKTISDNKKCVEQKKGDNKTSVTLLFISIPSTIKQKISWKTYYYVKIEQYRQGMNNINQINTNYIIYHN